MPGAPNHSYPGPFVRWKLGSTYEDMDPKPDGLPSDIVARSFNDKNESEIEQKNHTNLQSLPEIISRTEREENEKSFLNRMILTRKGVYRALESRIN